MAPNNSLPIWGNEKTMNLNPLILTNIQSSPYFKVNLYELKTYHEVIDEIYYKVSQFLLQALKLTYVKLSVTGIKCCQTSEIILLLVRQDTIIHILKKY